MGFVPAVSKKAVELAIFYPSDFLCLGAWSNINPRLLGQLFFQLALIQNIFRRL